MGCSRDQRRARGTGTVITEQAVSRYHLTVSLNGWLIQAPAPLTPAQISTARQLALTHGATFETQASALRLSQISDGATALGMVIALSACWPCRSA